MFRAPLLLLIQTRGKKTPVCPKFNIFGNTGVAELSAVSLSHKNTAMKRSTIKKKSHEAQLEFCFTSLTD